MPFYSPHNHDFSFGNNPHHFPVVPGLQLPSVHTVLGEGKSFAVSDYPVANATAAVGSTAEPFPASDYTMVDKQIGVPSPRPGGCTEAARSGWDKEGWWYRGEHDDCPVPATHRHSFNGQVTFAGFDDILQLVIGIIERVRR
ncbi:hypothetical protein BKA67DRAFT_554941 [Truncatella angustata]|uniref:Uncharacterized protein n=1 Tax=Truncatella angustata TaxID=152316 RepID=A0A9P8UQV0_9PEZI|nr:uncharacterized protein BKA67DRAFT_554941 [Truncatella angustata]KAH6657310.1 hypothetical protein BKA67DRAFT_554941 [Truncatella angustata]